MRVTPQCDTINSLIIADAGGVQTDPSVVFNGENYIVVWTDGRFPNYRYWVVTARITPQGAVLDTGNCIGYCVDQRESYPDIAFDGSRCLAVWLNFYPPQTICGRFINSAAMPEDTVITISAVSTSGYVEPKIAFDGTNYLVIYVDRPGNYYNIYGQLISPNGSLIGEIIPIACDPIDQKFHDLIWDGHFYVIVWLEGSFNVKGQRVDAAGQLVGSSFQISSMTSNFRDYPSIARAASNYLVVWSEYRNAEYDVYGNVDQLIGTEERKVRHDNNFMSATIISGQITLPKDKPHRVYDISGREVDLLELVPGIYFIEIDGCVRHKVIKIQ